MEVVLLWATLFLEKVKLARILDGNISSGCVMGVTLTPVFTQRFEIGENSCISDLRLLLNVAEEEFTITSLDVVSVFDNLALDYFLARSFPILKNLPKYH